EREELAKRVDTARTRSFLEKAESPELLGESGFTPEHGPKELRKALERHLSAGSWEALNNASLAALKQSALSREAVDILGSAGAAQLLAARLRETETPEAIRRMAAELGEYHARTSIEKLEKGLQSIEADLGAAEKYL